MKGFLLGGTNSGTGKTTLSMGLMSCFDNVMPFKAGPDYIDGKFHEYVTGNKSYNLDYFLMGEEGIKKIFAEKSQKNSVLIVEGVMGLYDGMSNSLDNGSSAHISRILNLPVILVVDGTGKSTSIAAQIMGYQNFDRRVNIIGVIINRVSSEKTYNILKEAVEKYCNIECFGYLPKFKDIEISSRHLGLIQADEIKNLKEKTEKLKKEIQKTVDIDKIYKSIEFKEVKKQTKTENNISDNLKGKYSGIKIGIAKDEAFSFYYNDNLEFLQELGAELKYFSPVCDKKIPENIHMLYFGGGYPENYACELSENISMKKSIQEFYNKNGVIYGECGGYIYLSKSLTDTAGKEYRFIGLTDDEIEMTGRLNIKRFGYINVEYKGFHGKGHEFHYSKLKNENLNIKERVFKIEKPDGRKWECGVHSKNLLCGYPHLYFRGSTEIIFNLLEKAVKYKEQKNE